MYSREKRFERTESLIGKEALSRLLSSRVAVFGLGGVGGYSLEALVRAGIGELVLVDSDKVDVSNMNRQIIATEDTVGMKKTEAARRRAESINPDIKITDLSLFVSEENVEEILKEAKPDYIIDAIDTVPSKTALIVAAHKLNIPIISSMGTGNKLEPSLFKIVDISKTDTCPLAKAMRKALREKGIAHTDVLYSSEKPIESQNCEIKEGRRTPASISFVPSVAGLLLGGYVIKKLAGIS